MASASQRKHRLSAEERKSAIVDAAVRLFSAKGFQGTTTRELAAAVGVTEPVLYQHFKTKGDLYSAIIGTICGSDDDEHPCDEQLDHARAAGDDHAFFGRLGQLMLGWYEDEPQAVRLLLYSALEGHELKDRFFERKVAFLYQDLNEYIRRRMDAGAFRRMDPYLAARAFVGMLAHQGMATTIFGLHDLKGTREEIVTAIVDIFVSGMKKPATEPPPRMSGAIER